MIVIKKYGFYLISFLIFIFILTSVYFMKENCIQFILKRYADVVELFFNNRHIYITGIGYVDANHTYTIGRNCLGNNFVSLLFIFNCFAFLKNFNGLKKLLWIFLCLVFSIIIGFIVNCMRLISSIPFAQSIKFNLIHATIGVAIYLFTIVLVYGILKKRFERREYV